MAANRIFSYRHVAGASLSNVLYFVAQSIVFLALTPATLQALGKELYGLWTIMLAVLGFSNLAQFGTDVAVAKYTAQYSAGDHREHTFSAVVTFSYLFVLIMGLVASLVIFLARFWIVQRLDTTPHVAAQLPSVFGLIALGIIPGFLFSVSRGILLGLLRNNAVNAIDVSTNIVSWISALVVGLRGGSVVVLACLVIAVNVIRLLWSTILAFRATQNYDLHFFLDANVSRDMLRFSSISWVTSLGATLFQSVDRLLVGMTLGPATAGMYGIATSVAARLTGLTSRLTQALMPFSSAQAEAGYRQRVSTVLRFSNRLVGCMSLLITGVLVIWMDEILRLWISPDFATANSTFFRLIVICYGIASMALPAQQISQGMGWITLPAVVYLGGGILMNLLIWVLAPIRSLNGVAVANLALISLLLVPFYLARKLSLSRSTVLYDLGVPFLAFAVPTVGSSLTSMLALRVVGSVVLFGAMLWLALGQERFRILMKALKSA